MPGSTEDEPREADSRKSRSRDQHGERSCESRSPERRRSKERSRHSHESERDRAVSESSRHRSSQRDLPAVDYRQYYDFGRQGYYASEPWQPPLPAYEPPPRPPLPLYPHPSFYQGQWGSNEYAESAFTVNKGTPPLQVTESVGGTGRITGLAVGEDIPASSVGRGVLSEAPSDHLSSISHSSKGRTATALFVAQPASIGKLAEGKNPAAAGKESANLYERVAKAVPRPSERDLVESGLFKSFGEAAVVQGVEDSSPKFCLDPAQKATLSSTLRTSEPWKLKATPSYRLKKYPIHQDSEEFLHVSELDPLFVKAAACAPAGLSPSDPLVISRAGENMDKQLKLTQNALQTGIVAACALQQGLGKLKDKIAEGSDPAIVASVLSDVFEASQDVIDQMGRASAIQQYSRRLQVVRSSNLHATEFQDPMLRLPLKEVWLFGEDVQSITSKCAAQKAVARCFSGAKQNFQQRGEKRKSDFRPKSAKRSNQGNPFQGNTYQGGNHRNNKRP